MDRALSDDAMPAVVATGKQPATAGAGSVGASWRPALLWSAIAFAVQHAIAEMVALVTAYGLHFPQMVRADPGLLRDVWFRWDAGWYTLIADVGYAHSSNNGFRSYAFGPVLPYSIRAVSHVLGVTSVTAGLVVTNICMLAALILLFRFVEQTHGRRIAGITVVMLLLWPVSYFLIAPYTESVVLLLAVGAFMAARRDRWWLAGLLAAAAVMTKLLLICLLAGLLWRCLAERRRLPLRTLLRDATLLLAPTALALIGWMVYMNHLFGDPLAFVHAQADWGRSIAPPWTLLKRTAGDLIHLRFLDDTPAARMMEPFDAVTLGVIIAAAVYWWRARVRSYAVWLGAVALLFLCSGALLSETREVLALFPVFIAGAMLMTRRPWLERIYTPVAVAIAVFLLARFVDHRFTG
jgi:Mannosyltransferase (PIG-V)